MNNPGYAIRVRNRRAGAWYDRRHNPPPKHPVRSGGRPESQLVSVLGMDGCESMAEGENVSARAVAVRMNEQAMHLS